MKRRSMKQGRSSKRNDGSSYAEKQGRARSKDGKAHGRTRYAATSPFSEDFHPDYSHRLARVCLAALLQARESDRARGVTATY